MRVAYEEAVILIKKQFAKAEPAIAHLRAGRED